MFLICELLKTSCIHLWLAWHNDTTSVCGHDLCVCRHDLCVCQHNLCVCVDTTSVCVNMTSVCVDMTSVCRHDLCVCQHDLCVCRHDLCVSTRPRCVSTQCLCVHRQQKSSYTHSCLGMLNFQLLQLVTAVTTIVVLCASRTAGVLLFVAHSPDNSFMGFVVEQHLLQTKLASVQRKNQAVVYGKALYMWQVTRSLPSSYEMSFGTCHFLCSSLHFVF